MTISGSLTINPNESAAGTPYLNVIANGNIAVTSTTTITRTNSATSNLYINDNSANSYNLTTCNLAINTGGTLNATTFVSASTITITGTGTCTSRPFYMNGCTYTISTSIFKYTGSGANTEIDLTVSAASTDYYDLYVLPGASTTHILGTASSQELEVSNNLYLGGSSNGASTVITAATYNPTFTLAGNLTICTATCSNQMTYTKGSGTLTMSPSGTKSITDNNTTKQDLGAVAISGGASTPKITLGSSVTITSLNIAASHEFDANGSNTLTITGASTPLTRGGTFTRSTGTVTYTSATGVACLSSAAMTGSNAFYNLTINSSGQAFNANVAVTATNKVTVTAGTLAMAANALIVGSTGVTDSGQLSVASGHSLTSSGTVTINSSASSTASCLGGTSLPGCTGTVGTFTLSTLAIGDGATTMTTAFGGTTPSMTISTLLNITASATFNAGTASTITLSGAGNPITKSGNFRCGTSTVSYTSATGITALSSAAMTGDCTTGNAYYNLTINSSGQAFNANVAATARNKVTVTAGTLAMAANALIVGSTGGTDSGQLSVASGHSLTSSGTVTINSSASSTASCLGGTSLPGCTGTVGTFTLSTLAIGDGATTMTTAFGGTTPSMTISTLLNITASATFNAGTASTITLSGAGTPITKSGNFRCGTS